MKKVITLFSALVFSSSLLFSFNTKKTVIIDAGHGGNDHGAAYNDVLEKNIALAVASKIKSLNKDENTEIILTRENDSYPSLSDRSAFVNKKNPVMVISLHLNRNSEANTQRNGTEIYYSENNEKALASKILAEKLASKFENSSVKSQNLHILRASKSPALLVEMGFINNKEDRELLTSQHGQNQYAQKILDFISEN